MLHWVDHINGIVYHVKTDTRRQNIPLLDLSWECVQKWLKFLLLYTNDHESAMSIDFEACYGLDMIFLLKVHTPEALFPVWW
jgi:hypothetical protein